MLTRNELAALIDHTLLKPTATLPDIKRLCEEARQFHFAAVCVNPCYVRIASQELADTPVKVCTVIGFPLGATSSLMKAMEAEVAIADGAQELDMVMNIGAFKHGDLKIVEKEIRQVTEVSEGRALVKVILETGYLSREEIVTACRVAQEAGAQFVKTSTGFGPRGATVEDIVIMREAVGQSLGIKASGGIREYEVAIRMVEAGANRLGTSAGVALVSWEG
ncbi:deoxyribose-phosphate aldolase [Thermanaeromonas sp. C210]|nr:deoxyribose-phosphate aldolase [Thermanaeromonas sp. C210]GFN22358.1 deoxyribose-phosphate aldolase [Thermanaeromonas sp. C210]